VKPGVGSAGLTLRRLRVSVGTGEVERVRELLPEPAAGVGAPTSAAARLLQMAPFLCCSENPEEPCFGHVKSVHIALLLPFLRPLLGAAGGAVGAGGLVAGGFQAQSTQVAWHTIARSLGRQEHNCILRKKPSLGSNRRGDGSTREA